MEKTCFKCKKKKPYDLFYKCKKSKDGIGSTCKACYRERSQNQKDGTLSTKKYITKGVSDNARQYKYIEPLAAPDHKEKAIMKEHEIAALFSGLSAENYHEA